MSRREHIAGCSCYWCVGARSEILHNGAANFFPEPDKYQVMPWTLRSYTSAERKEMPVWSIIANYFPDAFAALARHSKKANDKHNPGEPMHWARRKSKDHLECAVRHLMTPDTIDADTGEIELVGALWRCAAALQLREEARLKKLGILPLSGVTD